jgi:hypothetical protein
VGRLAKPEWLTRNDPGRLLDASRAS